MTQFWASDGYWLAVLSGELLDLGDSRELLVGGDVLVPSLDERLLCTLLLVLDQLLLLGGLYPAASRNRGEQRLPVFFVDLGAALVDDPVVSAAGEWHRRLAVLAARCVAQCEGLGGREPLREVDERFVVEVSVIVLLCQQINT